MENTILSISYENFLELASDYSMKKFILKDNQNATENELWHKYLEYDIKAPFSNYCSGHGRQGRSINEMAGIADYLRGTEAEKEEKVHIRNFVNQILTSDDYKKIGPAIDHFGFFMCHSNFENEIFMNNLLAFMMNNDVPEEYKVIMFVRAEQVFQNSNSFKYLRLKLNESSECKEIKQKKNDFYAKEGVHSKDDFLKKVFAEYK